ncbi:MAG TPA: aconitase family protein [Polyangiaceae bacterium]|nr:aconitase family protein [Polyangiaceae bacterium]
MKHTLDHTASTGETRVVIAPGRRLHEVLGASAEAADEHRTRDKEARTVYGSALGVFTSQSHPPMRARAGDPPRTMAQKILAARSGAAPSSDDFVEAHVDQVVLARAPLRAYGEALALGLKKSRVEVAVAYEGRCVGEGDFVDDARFAAADMVAHGIVFARAGVGFPAPVHLERFASPARLCVTDEPRLAGVGGLGMLTLIVPTASLGRALAHGSVLIRPPASVQILLGGRLRPFVCARDVALELIRRGLGEVVRRVEHSRAAPVVIEFGGPSARLLSVAERSVMAGIAQQVGAAAAVFVGDERTEVFLRDQRRSKAHRALSPDAGAPWEEVINVDLGAVDPLLLDTNGSVRAVRDLAGQPVTQALLGGDGGVTLRDLFAAATLLKSKRVPMRLDFLVAAPSRQMLEVLSRAGALTDFIATGARLVEPDPRVVTGELYVPPPFGVSLRTCDPEPCVSGRRASVVASSETIAYAVATGVVGDPRAFKRPVRVTVPRALPTDDVLVARKVDRSDLPISARATARAEVISRAPWNGTLAISLVEAEAFAQTSRWTNGSGGGGHGAGDLAVICTTLDEVREFSTRAGELSQAVRAVLAPHIPSGLVALFSAAGIAALRIEEDGLEQLKGQRAVVLPAPSRWPEREPAYIVASGGARLALTWLALGAERTWVTQGPAETRSGDGRPSVAEGAAGPPRKAGLSRKANRAVAD